MIYVFKLITNFNCL